MPLSFFCLAAGPRYISGPEVAMFYLLETVLAPVWMWMIFYETPTRNSLIGGVILIVALVAHSVWQLAQGRRRRAQNGGRTTRRKCSIRATCDTRCRGKRVSEPERSVIEHRAHVREDDGGEEQAYRPSTSAQYFLPCPSSADASP